MGNCTPVDVSQSNNYPILPNTPQWHKLGENAFGYGYKNGEQFLFASLDDAFRTHTTGWNVDGQNVSLDQVIAYYLSLIAYNYRLEDNKMTSSNNIGVGFYYITNSQGDNVYQNIQDPVLGTNANASHYGDNHSERVLAQDMYSNIMPRLKQMGILTPGMTLHYIIFTQLPPCPTCTGNIPNWEGQLKSRAAALGVQVALSVYGGTWAQGQDPRYTEPTSINDIMQYYP